MFRFSSLAIALLAFASVLPAQMAGTPPQSAPQNPPAAATQPAEPAKRKVPQSAKEEAPGGGPDKVWVNLNSSKYHCPGDRFYGKTANGRFMTEAAAKSAGAKGVGGKTCFAK
jgi:hypothetical protein